MIRELSAFKKFELSPLMVTKNEKSSNIVGGLFSFYEITLSESGNSLIKFRVIINSIYGFWS
jgi:hypothetical protein